MEIGVATGVLPPTLRLTLATGLLGGFTTYSSFKSQPTSPERQVADRPRT